MNQYFYDFDIYQSPSRELPSELLTGSNEKNLLIVVLHSDYSTENQEFLTKVLGAVDYDIANDTTLLRLPDNQELAVNRLVNHGDYKQCLMFGVDPKKCGYSFESFLYAPFIISNTTFILGNSLSRLKGSVEYKKALWNCLQTVFNKK